MKEKRCFGSTGRFDPPRDPVVANMSFRWAAKSFAKCPAGPRRSLSRWRTCRYDMLRPMAAHPDEMDPSRKISRRKGKTSVRSVGARHFPISLVCWSFPSSHPGVGPHLGNTGCRGGRGGSTRRFSFSSAVLMRCFRFRSISVSTAFSCA